jgi:nucleoside-diphosphate-sugar epimerase
MSDIRNKILITGASGFIGRAISENLAMDQDCELILAYRQPLREIRDVRCVAVGEVNGDTRWEKALDGVQVVIHTAARAHIFSKKRDTDLSFKHTNVDGALALAHQAIDAGVKRLVFISSIGVNGQSTMIGEMFNDLSPPNPSADYAVSKYEAEQALQQAVAHSAMELVIVRPPLVYAAHAPGNFRRLMKLVSLGLPLPFGGVENQRSLIALENLVGFIRLCIKHPAAANELFLISDGGSISTTELIRWLAEGMGAHGQLFHVPDMLLMAVAKLTNRRSIYSQLYGSLVIDSSKARNMLGWSPSIATAEALMVAGRDFAETLKR